MIGKQIGHLKVAEKVSTPEGKNHKRGPFYRCTCDRCGNENYTATSGDLRSGRIVSCGCWRNSDEFFDLHIVTHGQARSKRGREKTRTYKAWCEMKKRCTRQGSSNWRWYGGRGITYADRWETFENFSIDMGECPPGLELDRIDTNGNYEPGNCRWVTHLENCRNRRPRG